MSQRENTMFLFSEKIFIFSFVNIFLNLALFIEFFKYPAHFALPFLYLWLRISLKLTFVVEYIDLFFVLLCAFIANTLEF